MERANIKAQEQATTISHAHSLFAASRIAAAV